MIRVRLLALLAALVVVIPTLTTQAQSSSWENITPASYAIRSVAVDPAHPGTVYAGMQDNTGGNSGGRGIGKSTDYGVIWARVDQAIGAPCNGSTQFDGIAGSISVAPNGDVFAVNNYGCRQGVFRSTDGGGTWTNLFAGDFQNVSIDPTNSAHLIAAYRSRHDICNEECDADVVESTDGGTTWHHTAVIPGAGWGQHAFFITSTTWLVNADGNGLFRTTNSGTSWTKVSDFSTIGAAEMVRVGSAIYTGVAEGLLRSTDNGATWTNVLPEGTPDVYMALAADQTGRLYTHSSYPFGGFGGGPFKTSADGLTWANVGNQAFSNGPAHMAADDQYVYAANWNLGLWRLPIGAGSPSATATPTIPPAATATPSPTSGPCFSAYFQGGVLKIGPQIGCP